MEKLGCSLTNVATEHEMKVDQNDIGDQAVNKELLGFQGDQSYFKQGGLASGAAASAIFPEEVWEVILNQVDTSEDIHNGLLAFPELDKAFQRKKALWLFGAVLPYLMTKHLAAKKYKELFKLRHVSKRWKASVESSLKSHAELENLPLPCQNQNNQKLMPSENHFSYHRLDASFGATILHSDQQIDEFLNAMSNHSGNPFPGRYVSIRISTSSIDRSLALFQKFGEHVLFLKMEVIEGRYGNFQLCQHVLECLSHTPRLRSLTITGGCFCKPLANNLFPDLPNLEAFNWLVAESDVGYLKHLTRWTSQMIQKYGGKEGLKKIGLFQINCPLPSSLTSLTELNLFGLSEMTGLGITECAINTLPNPQELRKLRLQTRNPGNITKLLNFLAAYKVETLVMEGEKLYEEPKMELKEVASIKSLHLSNVLGVSYDYDFLKRLPNLQFLTIHFKLAESWGWRDYFKEEVKPCDPLVKRIRGFVLKVCDKNVEIKGNKEFSIWMELPQLKMMSVRVTQNSRIRNKEASVWNVKFVRECGNKAFFGPCSDGNEKLHVEEDDWWDDSSDDSEEYADL